MLTGVSPHVCEANLHELLDNVSGLKSPFL
jgi:hypothetical protein